MPAVSDTISNLINGISQQPFALRLPSQAEEQVNCYAHVVDGLSRAPASLHVKKISTVSYGNAHVHSIKRDKTEKYKAVLMNGAIKVFDLLGNEKTVNAPDGFGYLNTVDPKTELAAITVADYTFILNKTKSVAMGTSLSPVRAPEALIFIKATGYVIDVTATVNGTPFNYTASSTSAIQSTSTIATALAASMTTGLGAAFTITVVASVIHIKRVDGTDFTITTKDNQSDSYVKCIKKKTDFLSNLPTKAPKDFLIEISGDAESNKDNYFLKFVPNNTTDTFGQGVWEETVAQGIPWEIDATTMPHGLVREANGTFTFKKLEWGKREAGDTITNPDRTFIGRTINDIFFFRDRLSFLTDENAVSSRTTEFFDFFRSTVTTKVDNDPIDKAATDKEVVILRYAVPFNESIILFADNAQFLLQAPDKLSQDTLTIDNLTRYESNLSFKPYNTGKTVLFGTTRGEYVGVVEFFVQKDTLATDTADITGHCPQFLPLGVFKAAASTTEDVALLLSEKTPNRIYVYKYYWNNSEKVQSSWSYFELDPSAKVLDVDFVSSLCHLMIERDGEVFMETMRFDVGRADLGSVFEYCLHRKVTEAQCSVVYNPANDRTIITLPYTAKVTPRVVTRFTTGSEVSDKTAGIIVTLLTSSGATIDLRGDWTKTKLMIGQPYQSRYEFSRPVYKTRGASGQMTPRIGRLQIIRWTLTFADTGFIKLVLNHTRGVSRFKQFTGKILGSMRAIIGEIPLDSGTFSTGVKARSDKVRIAIESDSHLPFKILSAEWTGIFSARGRTP